MQSLLFQLIFTSFVLLSSVNNVNAGITSIFIRKEWPSVDIPLDNEVFAVPRGHNAPQQVHITQGDYDGKAVIISWVTANEPGSSKVQYGTSEGKYEFIAEGKMTNYTFYKYNSGYIHHVVVDGLEYDTKYYYKIGTGDSAREFWFQTPPNIGPDVPYKFGIIGDLGQTYNSLSTLEHFMQSGAQTVLFVGDLSYADRYQYNDVGIRWDSYLPLWRSDGVFTTVLLHIGPVEFLYYWLHRALHHHYLYSRYHSHHHSSIATEPITSVIHPFAEEVSYFFLFAIPLFTMAFTGTASMVAVFGYMTYVDFMNNMGHCNFELVPNWIFSIFPPLKYFMYTPSYHSLHHTQFRTNYALFMPIYDYIYDTVDKSSDTLYESSLKRPEESPDVVYLTHLTTTNSIYHLRLGFASLASKPFASSAWYLTAMWPVTYLSAVFITWIYGRTFVSDRNGFKNVKLQSWVVPRYNMHYLSGREKEDVNNLIEEAILEANMKGAKVLSLGLLNQQEELNGNGELYIQRYPSLKIKLVDGSSLAAAVVVNSILEGTSQVLLTGKPSKVSFAIALSLCQKGVQVATINKDRYKKLSDKFGKNLVFPDNYEQKIWLVGEGLSAKEQMKARKGTLFIPFSQFPPKEVRKDCYYHTTPAMVAPKSFENLHSCENWLPRRAMSAWRVAGIVHGVEGWNFHECGETMFNMDKVWEASLEHGFRPLPTSILV